MVGEFNRQDFARILKAQTFKGAYYPRDWIQEAIHGGWSCDDICSLIAISSDILKKMFRDMVLPLSLRSICYREMVQRGEYNLPCGGCPWVSAESIKKSTQRKRGKSSGVFDGDEEVSLGHYITYQDVMIENSANTISVFAYIVREVKDRCIKEQSERLALRLEALGVPAYRKLQGRFHKLGLITDLDEEISLQYRNILLIPSVAISKRSNLKKELSFWMSNVLKGADYLRYLVVTGGENIGFYGDLRGHHRKYCRRISDAFKIMKSRYGAEIFFRGTEATIGSDCYSINQHFNILYKIPYLSGDKFKAFLSELLSLLGCQAKDSGVLKSADEVVKYVTKPNDIERMTDDVLLWFFNETKKIRQFQTYNSFKEFRSELSSSGRRIVFDRGSNRLKLMKKRLVNDDQLSDYSKKEVSDEFGRDAFASLLAERNISKESFERSGDEEENKIVGMMLPHYAFMNISEPCLIVRNFTRSPVTDIGKKALELMAQMQADIHLLVNDKLKEVGCCALLRRDYRAIRAFFATGNRDVFSIDRYILDTLHHNSHEHPPPRRERKSSPAPSYQGQWGKGFRAPVQA